MKGTLTQATHWNYTIEPLRGFCFVDFVPLACNRSLLLRGHHHHKYWLEAMKHVATILVALGGLATLGTCSDGDLALGVYWLGETVPSSPQQLEKTLADMQAHSINAVWLTHTSATRAAEIARLATPHGIRVVACLGGYGQSQSLGKQIDAAIKSWGDAPAPLAWGLLDQSSQGYFDVMQSFNGSWKSALNVSGHSPGPTTAVFEPADIRTGARSSVSVLTCDIYSFFSKGSPYGPSGQASLEWWKSKVNNVRRASPSRPFWVIGQAFQDVVGPFDVDKTGNITLLPGSANQHAMPTPEELKWQVYSGFSFGAKGFFAYTYEGIVKSQANVKPLPKGDRRNRNWNAIVSHPSPSGLPYGFVRKDGTGTPQYDALATAFAKAGTWRGFLANTLPDERQAADLIQSINGEPGLEAPNGAIVHVLADQVSGKNYLMIVGDAMPSKSPIEIAFRSAVTLRQVSTRQVMEVAKGAVKQFGILGGDAEVYEIL